MWPRLLPNTTEGNIPHEMSWKVKSKKDGLDFGKKMLRVFRNFPESLMPPHNDGTPQLKTDAHFLLSFAHVRRDLTSVIADDPSSIKLSVHAFITHQYQTHQPLSCVALPSNRAGGLGYAQQARDGASTKTNSVYFEAVLLRTWRDAFFCVQRPDDGRCVCLRAWSFVLSGTHAGSGCGSWGESDACSQRTTATGSVTVRNVGLPAGDGSKNEPVRWRSSNVGHEGLERVGP